MGGQSTAFEFPQKWEQLYVELGPLLFNYGCKITPHTTIVEDSIHDVFVNLLRNPQHAATIDNPKAYLFTSFRRHLLKKLRDDVKAHMSVIVGEDYPFDIEVSIEAYRILEEDSAEKQKRLSDAIQHLSPRQREAIYLKFYENHSYEEVASIMKQDKSALYTLIYKSLNQLRKHLAPVIPAKVSADFGSMFFIFGANMLF